METGIITTTIKHDGIRSRVPYGLNLAACLMWLANGATISALFSTVRSGQIAHVALMIGSTSLSICSSICTVDE
jgi:hypothetical protein